MEGYKKLIVWKKSEELALKIYQMTVKFPRNEIYGLTSQLRRSALSVSTNIAEGTGRQNINETRHFVNIALGSYRETQQLLDFSLKLNYVTQDEYIPINELREEVGRLLWGFYRSFT